MAGPNANAVIALHDKAKAAKAINACPSGPVPEDPVSQGIPCSQFSTDFAPIGASRDVYLMVAQGDVGVGVAGMSCGVQFGGGVAVFGWTLCADLEFPNGGWPANGGGNRITWDATTNCQTTDVAGEGVHAVAGSFYLYAYSDGLFEVTPNNGVPVPELQVADCSAASEDVQIAGGAVGFGALEGFNPCGVVPVEETSWGKIKGAYN
jgi:hypothetical protein